MNVQQFPVSNAGEYAPVRFVDDQGHNGDTIRESQAIPAKTGE
jgi:hypothetical protein